MVNALSLVLSAGVGLAAAVLLLIAWLRRSLTPRRRALAPVARPSDPPPQRIRLPTVRQRSLNALWLPNKTRLSAPAVVLLHGWGGQCLIALARRLPPACGRLCGAVAGSAQSRRK
jgi:hypothetical protein